jgi:hypothetical protein
MDHALGDDEDPIAPFEQLIKIAGVNQNSGPVSRSGAQALKSSLRGTDIQPSPGVLRDQHPRLLFQGTSKDELLLVSTTQGSSQCAGSGRGNLVSLE